MAAKKKAKSPAKKAASAQSAAETHLLKARLVSSKHLTSSHRKKLATLSASEVKALVSAKKKLGKGSLHGRGGADFF